MRMGNTRHVQIISQSFVARTMADPYCCCEVVYRLGAVVTHQHRNSSILRQFELFVADQYVHPPPNCLSLAKSVGAT